MPITKSAKKALRQNKARQKRNSVYRDRMRKLEKEFNAFLVQKKKDEAQALLRRLFQVLDKSAKEQIISSNRAGRRKSYLSRQLSGLKTA